MHAMSMCMYIRIHIHDSAPATVNGMKDICMYMSVCVCLFVYAYVSRIAHDVNVNLKHTHTHIYTHIHTHLHVRTHIIKNEYLEKWQSNLFLHTFVCMYMCIHTHIYMHIFVNVLDIFMCYVHVLTYTHLCTKHLCIQVQFLTHEPRRWQTN